MAFVRRHSAPLIDLFLAPDASTTTAVVRQLKPSGFTLIETDPFVAPAASPDAQLGPDASVGWLARGEGGCVAQPPDFGGDLLQAGVTLAQHAVSSGKLQSLLD